MESIIGYCTLSFTDYDEAMSQIETQEVEYFMRWDIIISETAKSAITWMLCQNSMGLKPLSRLCLTLADSGKRRDTGNLSHFTNFHYFLTTMRLITLKQGGNLNRLRKRSADYFKTFRNGKYCRCYGAECMITSQSHDYPDLR